MHPTIAHIICMPLNNNIKLSVQSVKLEDRQRLLVSSLGLLRPRSASVGLEHRNMKIPDSLLGVCAFTYGLI